MLSSGWCNYSLFIWQPDQGLYFLQFLLHFLEPFLYCLDCFLKFEGDYSNILGIKNCMHFTAIWLPTSSTYPPSYILWKGYACIEPCQSMQVSGSCHLYRNHHRTYHTCTLEQSWLVPLYSLETPGNNNRTYYTCKPEHSWLVLLYNLETPGNSIKDNFCFHIFGNVYHVTTNPYVTLVQSPRPKVITGNHWKKKISYRVQARPLVIVRNITKTFTCNIHVLQFTAVKKIIFRWKYLIFFSFFFAQNIDCGCLNEAVLMSTHNLCFRAKIRKKSIPLLTPVLLYESEV